MKRVLQQMEVWREAYNSNINEGLKIVDVIKHLSEERNMRRYFELTSMNKTEEFDWFITQYDRTDNDKSWTSACIKSVIIPITLY